MASTVPYEIIDDDDDDDDEFDWEAAAKVVDIACQSSKPSNSRPLEPSHSLPLKNKKFSASRQSTLDQFVCAAGPRSLSEKPSPRIRNDHHFNGDEGRCCVNIDTEAAKTWIYPVNIPLRDYQLSITKTALFSNTIVALPTGLGKTLIAAVVMYNYFRWFPEGKIVFSAPSRPLVMQQIEACHNIVGIPQEWTIDMTGQTSPARRACLWKTKRVFFVTPQVLEKDIQSGACLVKHLVCLVIDEAHRASGNYSYCVAVRELMAVPVHLRILALTATPGSKQQAVQQIIDNLHISTLEYRNESDHDVSPYVHNRKIELIEVAMGRDAVEVNNLLSEVIRPFVAKLCGIGVLQNRDFQTLSPCDLLNSREKFRQAPPQELPHIKYGEIEGYFAVLITLYHIRKLLSSHGIRPAYEMLEEKMQHGSFGRLMNKNEVIWKAKLLMQQSLSHGATNPKLLKMLDVLIHHFKTNDPQNSRVIIFSNFRGSVRDIMDALASIGESVKATQFIGQSSGKTLKGQSQKVQQAVLEKFRAGGYNVIVATSIGEEGLDIMEVDLVICFDANVSPLRMIQRMGRTGRKHDGQVVVLACEGSELKGYMRKQANSRAVRKHMRNGGMNSFNFHPSPRMIPHIFKPEVQFVEMSIEQFVPRRRKIKDDHPSETPIFEDKLTGAETELLSKYFPPTRESSWRPSLIAFPHFQVFPSRVHQVMHSLRTGILIDVMQHLQGLSFGQDTKSFPFEDEASSFQCLGVEIVDKQDNSREASLRVDGLSRVQSQINVLDSEGSQRNVLDSEVSPSGIPRTNSMSDIGDQAPPLHSYLFGSDFVAVDALGKVLILSVPVLPFKEISHTKCASASITVALNYSKQDSCQFERGKYEEPNIEETTVAELPSPTISYRKNGTLQIPGSSNSDAQQGRMPDVIENGKPQMKKTPSNEGHSEHEKSDAVENKTPILLPEKCCNDFEDSELSPRLSNLMKNGVIPESPIDDGSTAKERNEFLVPELVSPAKLQAELLMKSPSSDKNKDAIEESNGRVRDVYGSISQEIHTPLLKVNSSANARGCVLTFPIDDEIQTPLANLTNSSCSKDWRLSSGDNSESVNQVRKFKRLRKHEDSEKRNLLESMKENSVVPMETLAKSLARFTHISKKHTRGKTKPVDTVSAFIEEEAEVSSDTEVSDDEEDGQDNNSYDDSFIDDRINPTAAGTQAGEDRVDMMAFYRRSLLSQTPIGRLSNINTELSPDCVAPSTRMTKPGFTPDTVNSFQTTVIGSANQSAGVNSVSYPLNPEGSFSEAELHTAGICLKENEKKVEGRKRKLSFHQAGSVPVVNLEQEFSFQLEASCNVSCLQGQSDKNQVNTDVLDDDQFYDGLDLDEVEAQAAMLLKSKSALSTQEQNMIPESNPQNLDLLGSPSFDLGI
ncbi:DEAD-box ATP-dependent RNA helicase FANCM isoform X2 [Malania oleifera]|uniref:DEAD-box ATP-dependent RNA helicase FANCM isoform X2 n=1 Tax=Malania oleifera TaxID=397392 RepID=UPI0025AE7B6A|nr:DEAD-box ATP-dependent RNA helicase FANCM isoform X2 [Malania oleifera]